MSSIGFENTIDIGNTSTEFLDVSLDLSLNTYSPYRKPNSKTSYITTIPTTLKIYVTIYQK